MKIREYNYKKNDMVFHLIGEDGNPHGMREEYSSMLFFGLELETELKDSSKSKDIILEGFDLNKNHYTKGLIACRDGSLDFGVEFITEPATYDFIENHIRDVTDIIKEDFTVGESCGGHIHINKSFLSNKENIYKLITFVNINPQYIKSISGRLEDSGFSSYARFLKEEKDTPAFYEKVSDITHSRDNERYSAVRITSNTIEFRFWGGCIDPEEIKKRCKWISTLCKFVKEVKKISELTESNFKDFLNSEGE